MVTPEWSHKIDADQVGAEHYRANSEASAQQCKDVARRLHVEKIENMSASFVLQRESGRFLIAVHGTVKADVTQLCVVTQEPLTSHIEEDFEAFYSDESAGAVSFSRARHEKLGKMMDAELHIPEERDDPEPVIDGKIDLGELAVEHLALAIDPYPQKEGASSDYVQTEEEQARKRQKTHNPFKALKDWKKDQK